MKNVNARKVLHSNSDKPTNGEFFVVSEADECSVSVFGTSTTFKAYFEVSSDGKEYFPIEAYALDDQSTWQTFTTNANQMWVIDISSCDYFRVRLESISDGEVSVKAVSYTIE